VKDLLYQGECYRIQGCVFEVNKKLGSGFLEAVYQEALEIELSKVKIPNILLLFVPFVWFVVNFLRTCLCGESLVPCG
jgi:hypothetical protein